MKKLSKKQLEQIVEFIAHQQRHLGGAMVIQLNHFGAKKNTVHTEIINTKVAEGKYLVSTTVEPLTQLLKNDIMKQAKSNEKVLENS